MKILFILTYYRPHVSGLTIYVERFNIVKAATSYWRISMWASLALLLTGLVIHFKRPYRPY